MGRRPWEMAGDPQACPQPQGTSLLSVPARFWAVKPWFTLRAKGIKLPSSSWWCELILRICGNAPSPRRSEEQQPDTDNWNGGSGEGGSGGQCAFLPPLTLLFLSLPSLLKTLPPPHQPTSGANALFSFLKSASAACSGRKAVNHRLLYWEGTNSGERSNPTPHFCINTCHSTFRKLAPPSSLTSWKILIMHFPRSRRKEVAFHLLASFLPRRLLFLRKKGILWHLKGEMTKRLEMSLQGRLGGSVG